MANPFQGVAQMGVNEFWGWLQDLSNKGAQLKAQLSTDRNQLMAAYTAARNDPDKVKGAAHMKALDPLVHNNSTLRLRYRDLAGKFKEAVDAASSMLQRAGLTTPTLTGLGVAPLIILGIAIAAAAAAWGIYESVALATQAQRQATTALLAILSDPNASPEAKLAAANALAKKAAEGNPFDLSQVTPILIGVLAIMVAPQVLSMIKSRPAAVQNPRRRRRARYRRAA